MTEDEMMNESESSSDDRLFAAMAYALSPLMPIIILIMPDKRDRAFIRSHNVQALIVGVLLWFIIVPLTIGCGSIGWLVLLYLAYEAYQGKTINIPLVSNFVKNQNWA